MTVVDGSLTLFRGIPAAITERHECVIDVPLAAGYHVYKGQVLVYVQGTNQSASPVAGMGERGDTNGVCRSIIDAGTYAGAVLGVCLKDIDDSDTTSAVYGKQIAPVLIRGITLMRAVVNATGTSDGYQIPFGMGDLAAVGGGNAGGTITGSNTVSGFTLLTPGAYVFMPTGATDGSGNTVIGWFLDFQDGHTTSQTVSDGTATIAASQATNPATWVRVYVDTTAKWAGGTMAKFTL